MSVNSFIKNSIGDFGKSAFYIIKSILYCFIYRNDRICINYLKRQKDPNYKDFVFVKNRDNDMICKIFVSIVNKFNRTDDLNRTIIYDFYVRKIFDLMIGKNEFFIKSLENLLSPSIPKYQLPLILSDDITLEMRQYLYFDFLNYLVKITTKLNSSNREYFDYNINLSAYQNQVCEIFKELKFFIFEEINFLPDLNQKYQIFKDKLTPDEITHEKICNIQDCVRYTLFFEKIEEFLFIYSDGKSFTNDSVSIISLDYWRMLLNFLFMLINKNYENLVLLMNFKTKCFVNSFLIIPEHLFDFLDLISEIIFSNQIKYQLDNFYFLTECLNDIAINIKFAGKDLPSKIKNLNLLEQVMKIAKKSISYITMSQPDPLNCVECIMDKIRMIKSDQDMNDVLMGYFFKEDALEVIRDEGLIQDSDFLFEIETVEYILHQVYNEKPTSKITLPVEIEIPMTRFYFLINFAFNLKLTEIKSSIENLFIKNLPKHIKNASLNHLSLKNEEKSETENLNASAEFILNLLKIFSIKFQKISIHYVKQNDEIARKINLFNFMEHCVCRPLFILFNQFLLISNQIRGTDCFAIYEILFYFLKSIVYFYENIDKPSDNLLSLNASFIAGDEKVNKDSSNLNNSNNAKADQNILLKNKNEILENEGICLKNELDVNIIKDVLEDSQKLSKNQIKYFDLPSLHTLFICNLQRILGVFNVSEEINPKTFTKTFTKTNSKFVSKSSETLRLEKLIEKYKDKVVSTYDDQLSLIKVLESTEGDSEVEFGSELYEYILLKFSDTLTDYNFCLCNEDTYEPGHISKLSVNTFKFQNIYTLYYLNALFYHDSEKFQKILEDNIGDNYETFFNFITTKLIMPSVLCEIRKVYELDPLNKTSRLCFEIAHVAIKFLQNICESHNQEFQNRFFNHIYDIEIKEYHNKIDVLNNANQNENDRMSFFNKKRTTMNTLLANASSSKKDALLATLTYSIGIKKTNLNMNLNKIENDSKDDNELENNLNENDNLDNGRATTGRKIRFKPQVSGEVEKNTHHDMFEKRKQKAREEMELLEKKKYSFLNFVCHNMRIIINHLHVDKEFNSGLIALNRNFKNYDNVLEIYQRFSDLIVEMIQGTSNKNFDNFYRRLPDNLNIFDELGNIHNQQTLESFIFIEKSIEIKSLLFETKNPFEILSLKIKYNLFFTINNIINQEIADISLVKIFITIFPPDKVIDTVSIFVRGIYIKHVSGIEYNSEKFNKTFDDFELNNEFYIDMIKMFKAESDIYDDDFFKLASQMYLYLTALGAKFSFPEAQRIIAFDKKEVVEAAGANSSSLMRSKSIYSKIFNCVKTLFSRSTNISNDSENNTVKKKKVKYHINNLIISAKFFNKIITSCEFVIDSSNDDADELKLKIIYFIIDPRVYLISKNNIKKFFDEVDRSSSTTKLKSLIDKLNFFLSEVDYKFSNLKKSKYLKWMLEVDYLNVDFMNFCISLIINFILLIFLKGENSEEEIIGFITKVLVFGQIFMNIVYLIIFLISKYKFYVLVEINEKSSQNPDAISILDGLKIRIFDSFLFNDEIYLMILNIIMGSLGLMSSYATFLFSLQLLTVIKFVPTIKEIVIAFKLRFMQLISMIGFLAILIYFYSNIGFYFLHDEFLKELDNGQKENLCETLLGCSITYFNLGVRSGGGIGDLLDMKPFRDPSIYWIRWITDMVFYITVILLLLNMINGVIVSTFSQIREESQEKEEDITNKCFICNIDRVEFEKRKIAFPFHLKHEHCTKTYIRFLIYLKLTSEKDLDADQSFIITCINSREITCFPVLRSKSVGDLQQKEDKNDESDD